MRAVIHSRTTEGSPVRIPSSKSLSHRALIAASLANGTSLIRSLVVNDDTIATMNCLRQLGACFDWQDEGYLRVTGIPDFSHFDHKVVDCGESGSTLRFLIPVFSLSGEAVTFTGHGKLMKRPQTVYEALFQENGRRFETGSDTLTIQGALSSGKYTVRGDISSQFISGLLFALPLCEGDSALHILEPYESRSYVGLTQDVLEDAGISVREEGNDLFLPGNSSYHPVQLEIDGDDSQGAFFAVLAMLSEKSVTVHGMRHSSRQGDHVIVDVIERIGGKVIPVEQGYRFEPGVIKPAEIDLSDCPDLGPALFALGAKTEGVMTFTHCGRLRIKESDRIAAMKEELGKLGVRVEEDGDTVRVHGVSSISGGVTLLGHNDHRIVMALSVLAACAEQPVVMEGAEAVNKSYPNFFEDLVRSGVEVSVE